jgi:uncharacterized protein (AIM24 family)
MHYDVQYRPAHSLAIVHLEVGESVRAEAKAMVSMTPNIAVETQARGAQLPCHRKHALQTESQGPTARFNVAPGCPRKEERNALDATGGSLRFHPFGAEKLLSCMFPGQLSHVGKRAVQVM